jgi:hypothetical protein
MEHKYKATFKGLMMWANSELEHVGRIVSMEDKDLQYQYALSTVNGMLHLRNALLEMVNDPKYIRHREDVQRTHDKVVRAIKHLIADFNVNIQTIRNFNERNTLGDLSYLGNVESTPQSQSQSQSQLQHQSKRSQMSPNQRTKRNRLRNKSGRFVKSMTRNNRRN